MKLHRYSSDGTVCNSQLPQCKYVKIIYFNGNDMSTQLIINRCVSHGDTSINELPALNLKLEIGQFPPLATDPRQTPPWTNWNPNVIEHAFYVTVFFLGGGGLQRFRLQHWPKHTQAQPPLPFTAAAYTTCSSLISSHVRARYQGSWRWHFFVIQLFNYWSLKDATIASWKILQVH